MPVNPELLAKQLEAAGKPRRPKGIAVNASTAIDYNIQLQRIVREIRKDIDTHLVPALKRLQPQYQRDAWYDDINAILQRIISKWRSPAFRALGESLATVFVRSADKTNLNKFKRSFGIDIYSDNKELTDYVAASILDNSNLIQSIPEQYLQRVSSVVMTNTRAGLRASQIIPQLMKEFNVTESRAKLIARDQTAKINANLAEKRQRSAGFEYFEWMDSDDQRVRERHHYLAEHYTKYGKGIYKWTDLPLSDSNQPISPGTDYQCRCVARPVGQAEVDANIKAGRIAVGVKR